MSATLITLGVIVALLAILLTPGFIDVGVFDIQPVGRLGGDQVAGAYSVGDFFSSGFDLFFSSVKEASLKK